MVKAKIKFGVDAGEGCHTAANIFALLPAGQPELVQIKCSNCSDLGGAIFKPLVDALESVPKMYFDHPSSVPLLLDASVAPRSIETIPDFPLPGLKRIYIIPPRLLQHQRAVTKLTNMLPALRETLGIRNRVHPLEVLKLVGGLKLPDEGWGITIVSFSGSTICNRNLES